jgi:hypothetical protein
LILAALQGGRVYEVRVAISFVEVLKYVDRFILELVQQMRLVFVNLLNNIPHLVVPHVLLRFGVL